MRLDGQLDPVTTLPDKLCDLDRLVETLAAHDLDGLVSYISTNVLYLSGFISAGGHSYQDANGQAAVVISRRHPEESVVLVQETQVGYFVNQPTWIRDIRPYGGSLIRQMDLPSEEWSVDRFLPEAVRGTPWAKSLRGGYGRDLVSSVETAMRDLGLQAGRVGIDNPWLGKSIDMPDCEIVDAYRIVKHVRAVKSAVEVELLRAAALVNRKALEKTTREWVHGMTWHELGREYQKNIVDLHGFCREPSPFAIANPRGGDSAYLTHGGQDRDYVLEPGMRIMFDTHGTVANYCWDGGKTWYVGEEPGADELTIAVAYANVMRELRAALSRELRISELQALGRDILRKSGVPNPERDLIFFHGLGLEHGEAELPQGDGRSGTDWTLRRGMVIATHLYHPGSDRERYWYEDITHVTDEGGQSLYGWDDAPLMPAG